MLVVLMIAAAARAAFVGLFVEVVTDDFLSDVPDGQGFKLNNAKIFELYAKFNNPDDSLFNVFNASISPSLPLYHALNADGEAQSTPLSFDEYSQLGSEVDSFVTIGFDYSGKTGNPGNVKNPVTVDPSFKEAAFIAGGSFGDNAGWFSNPRTSSAALAGTYPDLKVLIARFSYIDLPGQDITCSGISGQVQLTVKEAGGTVVQTPRIEFIAFGQLSHCNNCPGDSNFDNVIDGADLGQLLADWGDMFSDSDLNGDGTIDGEDLGILLAKWGPC